MGGEVEGTLCALVEECGNGVWFEGKKGIEVAKIVDLVVDGKFGEGVVPFACDEEEEEFLVIDGKGRIREWEEEEGDGEVLAESFDDFLEQYRNDLLAGKFEYVEDCGCMEKAGGGGSHK